MKKLITLLAMMMALSGCAAMNYGTYAKHATTNITAGENTKAEIAKSLGKAIEHGDSRTRDQATLSLVIMGVTHRTPQIEAPREGAIERGFSAAISSLPYVGGMVKLAGEMKGQGASTYHQTISGQGAGGALNTGAGTAMANTATSPPTVVTPVIIEHTARK